MLSKASLHNCKYSNWTVRMISWSLFRYSLWFCSLLIYFLFISGTIYEGTSNIQLSTIAKSLAQEYWNHKDFLTVNGNYFSEHSLWIKYLFVTVKILRIQHHRQNCKENHEFPISGQWMCNSCEIMNSTFKSKSWVQSISFCTRHF